LERIPLPAKVKEVLKSAFDMKMKDYLWHAVYRSWFTDQSQSLNVFFRDPNVKKTVALWDFGIKHDLKTISYYIRRRPAVETAQFAGISDQRADEIAAMLQTRVQEQTRANTDKSNIHIGQDEGQEEEEEEDKEEVHEQEQEETNDQFTSTGVNDFNFDFSAPAADPDCTMCSS